MLNGGQGFKISVWRSPSFRDDGGPQDVELCDERYGVGKAHRLAASMGSLLRGDEPGDCWNLNMEYNASTVKETTSGGKWTKEFKTELINLRASRS